MSRRRPALVESLEPRRFLSGTIIGHVHNDINSNGLADEGAIGAPPITFYLDQNRNNRLDKGEPTVISDSTGSFEFTNLHAPGIYYLRAEIPKNFNLTARAGSVTQVIDLQSSNQSVTVPTIFVHYVPNPWGQVGQNPQHTSLSPIGVASATDSKEVVVVDSSNSFAQLGSGLVTQFNTLIVPVLQDGVFGVLGISRATGATVWSYASDYQPADGQDGAAIFQPVIGKDRRVYVPGAGGTILAIGNPDFSSTNKSAVRLSPYTIDPLLGISQYRNDLFISTPLTVDSAGHIYYGVTSDGANPTGIHNSLIRMTPSVQNKSTSVIARMNVVPGVAPTLSNDEKSVYIPVNPSAKSSFVRMAAGTLKTISSVVLRDPSTQVAIQLPAQVSNTAVVGPDGDVYFGVTTPTEGTDSNGDPATILSTGWLLHFSANLKSKTPFNYGLNDTPSIVPSSMVVAYHGKSSYLIVSKSGNDDTRFNLSTSVSILDPDAASASTTDTTLTTKVMSTIAVANSNIVWPFYNAVVDVASGSIYFDGISSDVLQSGQTSATVHTALYRWNVSRANLLPTPIVLTDPSSVIGPSLVGADGELYVIGDSNLYAIATFASTT